MPPSPRHLPSAPLRALAPWTPEDPLAPLPGESLRANEALRAYVALGAGRTLDSLRPRYGLTSARWLEEWSRRWRWQERLAAWLAIESRRLSDTLVEVRLAEIRATLETYDWVEAQAREEWERSKKDAERLVQEAETLPGEIKALLQSGAPSIDPKLRKELLALRGKITKIVSGQQGDPRYLQTILKSREDRRKMLGLDMPAKVQLEHTGRLEHSVESDLARALSAAAEKAGGDDLQVIEALGRVLGTSAPGEEQPPQTTD